MGAIIPPTDTNIQFSDVTTNNASQQKHGHMPKLTGNAATFHDSQGNQTNPHRSALTTATFTAATKQLALTDVSKMTFCNRATAQTITIPLDETVAFEDNDTVAFQQVGDGAVTITAAAGVTLNGVDGGSVTLPGKHSSGYISRIGANAWVTPVGTNVIEKSFSATTGFNGTLYAFAKAQQGFKIDGLFGLVCDSGTLVATVKINGVNVTGLTAVVISSTPQDALATASAVVNPGDAVTIAFSSNASAVNPRFTFKGRN